MPIDPQLAVTVVAIIAATKELIMGVLRAVQDYRVALVRARSLASPPVVADEKHSDQAEPEQHQQDETLEGS